MYVLSYLSFLLYIHYASTYSSTQNSGFFPFFHLAVILLASRSNNRRRTRLRVRVTRPTNWLWLAFKWQAGRQSGRRARQTHVSLSATPLYYRSAPSSARGLLCCACYSYIAVLDYVQGKTTTQFLSRANRVCFSLKRTTTQRLTLNPYPIMDSGDCNSPT